MQASALGLGQDVQLQRQEKVLRTGKEKRDPRITLGLELLGVAALSDSSHGIFILQQSHLCFSCCSRHCLRQGEQRRAWGHILGTYFGEQRDYYAQETSGRAI